MSDLPTCPICGEPSYVKLTPHSRRDHMCGGAPMIAAKVRAARTRKPRKPKSKETT